MECTEHAKDSRTFTKIDNNNNNNNNNNKNNGFVLYFVQPSKQTI